MKYLKVVILISALFSVIAHSASNSGYVNKIYADPTNIVIVLNNGDGAYVNGQCGSYFYHINRSLVNFKEFYALILAAAASKKEVNLQVGGCESQRNILTHGHVKF